MQYIARKAMTVGTGKGRQVVPGDAVPEAAAWPNLRVYLANGTVEAVEDGEAIPSPEPAPEPPASASAMAIPPEPDPALANPCPTCDAEPGEQCQTAAGKPASPHKARG